MDTLGQNGVLQVVPPAVLEAQLQQQAQARAAAAEPPKQDVTQLVSYIKGQFEIFRNHRNTASGWSERMTEALRIFNGQYNPQKIAEIKKFGGSEVYARLIAQKCRAASSLLRDIYLGPDRPWALKAPADPDVPDEIMQKIDQLLSAEGQMMQQTGVKPGPSDAMGRKKQLVESAKEAAKKKAEDQAKQSESRVEEILRQGNFYIALAEFLVDLPIFPFAVIKGPVVKVVPEVKWPPNGGRPVVKQVPRLTWQRVSPFDIWFTPGVADIANANVIEKLRVTRAELNDLLDLPGYNTEEIRAVLDEYGTGGLYDNWDTTDSERAVLESRENPAWNRSGMLSMMEFNGTVQGRTLQEYGLAVPDELRDYNVQVWCIGSHVIKAHLSPSPRQRHPYFITSFEKVPGTPVGNGLTDLLSDLQEVSNATLRGLVNNLSISSGPQVVVNDDRVSSEEDGETLYPWKRWHVRNDPMGANNRAPIEFFQPQSNAQALIQVFQEFTSIADDVSAIPKYVGGQASGGAGRTASGLAMLMGNASKILQTVSANIDRDVMELALQQLSDLILLTDTTGLLTGEENLSVRGVDVAIQRETLRQRQLEFLQATANPVDQHIVGLKGRAAVLRSVASTIGLDGETIVPSDDQLDKMEKEQKQQEADGPIHEAVQQGVIDGVEQGVQTISAELTKGALAMRALPPGMPPGAPPGGPPPGGARPPQRPQRPPQRPQGPPQQRPQGMPQRPPQGAPPGMMQQRAAQAQGMRPRPLAGRSMGPQTNLTGNQPGRRARPIQGGVG